MGATAVGRQGLGVTVKPRWDNTDDRGRRDLIQQELRHIEEEGRLVRAASMKQQGAWLNWEGVRSRAVKWDDIWSMEGYRLTFLLRSVYDALPSPSNLCRWGLIEDPKCKLCKSHIATLEHVLSACTTALKDGRYTWRHDRILKVIAARLDSVRRNSKKLKKGPTFVNFVREGEKKESKVEGTGVMATATDWQMRADVNQRLEFPSEIVSTPLRPDIVIWSRETRQVILLELTVPWEERIEEAHERKRSKYQELVEDCQSRSWKTWCLPVEVGARGFAGQSLWRSLRTLGVIGATRRKLITEVCREAEMSSQWIWRKREEFWKKKEQ